MMENAFSLVNGIGELVGETIITICFANLNEFKYKFKNIFVSVGNYKIQQYMLQNTKN